MSYKSDIQKHTYEELLPGYQKLEKIVEELLQSAFRQHDIKIMQLPHRIKTWESVYGKLIKKPELYSKTEDLNDILGFRVICYFASEVDEAAAVLKDLFRIDYSHSKDKRSLLNPTTFGYLSLHYICMLKQEDQYPEELKNLRFEIQVRSVLQHVWAEIEHDLGYKTVLEIPRDIRREFSRVAGLLEVADESFDRIKTRITEYERDTLQQIKDDKADHLMLDRFTLKQFMLRSTAMKQLLSDMAGLTSGEITYASPVGYLPLFAAMKIETLGDLNELISNENGAALKLLNHALQFSDLEELTTNSALFYLCRARLIRGNYSEEQLREMLGQAFHDEKKVRRIAEYVLRMRNVFRQDAQ